MYVDVWRCRGTISMYVDVWRCRGTTSMYVDVWRCRGTTSMYVDVWRCRGTISLYLDVKMGYSIQQLTMRQQKKNYHFFFTSNSMLLYYSISHKSEKASVLLSFKVSISMFDWALTYMMWKICIHYYNEVSGSMFYSMNVCCT